MKAKPNAAHAAEANYKPPFPFSGKIHKVTVDVSGELIKDEEAELCTLLARQ